MTLPLEGIKVIDVSQVAAVPMCARHLADFGAEVIHVENPSTGDSWRGLQAGIGGGPSGVPSDIPYNWEAFNRNKRSLALNLKSENGRQILYKLLEDTDIFVTNLRYWERDKYKVDYETLKQINPRLIYGSVTGHGMKGADRDAPAYDTTVYWARAGVSHTLTMPWMSAPQQRPAFGDNCAALALAYGVMVSLYYRERTGIGQEIETSLFNTGIYQLTFDVAAALTTGEDIHEWTKQNLDEDEETKKVRAKLAAEAQEAITRLSQFGAEHSPNPMATVYRTKDDRLIRFNALLGDRYWHKFCDITGHPELKDDPRYADKEGRKEHNVFLYNLFKEAFLSKTLEEWGPLIEGIPASTIQNLVDVIKDPQAWANNFFVPFDHPTYGKMNILGPLVNLSETPATIRTAAPEFSQHTEEILLEAGYSWDDIINLKEQRVIP